MRVETPFFRTGGKGLPVPITARPSVQARRSLGVASDRDVGLDKGKMIGCCVNSATVRTTRSGKAPGWPDTPISTVRTRVARDIQQSDPIRLLQTPIRQLG